MAIRWLVRATLGILLSVAMAPTALAQQGYPSNYSPARKSYSSGPAIGIAAGAAAVVAVGFYAIHRHHATKGEEATVVGCTTHANGATTLIDDRTKTTYSLTSLSKDVKPGERVELTGRKSQDASRKNSFHVQKLLKDDGPCPPQTANAGEGTNL